MYDSSDYDKTSKLPANALFSYDTCDMSPSEFLKLCEGQHPKPERTHYQTAPLTSPQFVQLLRSQLRDWAKLKALFPSPPEGRLNPSIWVGGLGTVTQTHYDVYDNVLTNLCGRKRVRVFAPSDVPSLCMFPDADPRSRKSQLPLDEVGGGVEPLLDVVISYGDGVFIPAFYPHHCEVVEDEVCQSLSVSVNVFSSSGIGEQASKLLGSVGASDRVTEERGFEAAVLERLGAGAGAVTDLRQSVLDRYKQLLKRPLELSTSDDCDLLEDFQGFGAGIADQIDALVRLLEVAPHGGAIADIIGMHLLELVAVKRGGGSRDLDVVVRNL
ncbi:hypothetical protein TrVE_jg6696 [Triparma verrucosa]|uniref:JmjC domain-containing protein n=1 Tax=Triparma verrucosa TaxID=1606542 RepID=A0A9W7FB12_9STRA|nr:hypothetical protein TrVE_jg6696 [Triparma verrucosa]